MPILTQCFKDNLKFKQKSIASFGGDSVKLPVGNRHGKAMQFENSYETCQGKMIINKNLITILMHNVLT